MKLRESNKVKRADFMAQHFGKELEPNWIEMISGLPGSNWKKFAETRADEILTTRESLAAIAEDSGLPIPELVALYKQFKRARERQVAQKRRW